MAGLTPVELRLPDAGLDQQSALSSIHANYTPACLNVFPQNCSSGQRMISRRPALGKKVATQFKAAAFQNIIVTQVAVDETAGTGDVFSHAGTGGSKQGRVYGYAAGATQYTTTDLVSANTMGCVDEDNNFYIASVSGTSLEVRRIATDYTQTWAVTYTLAVSNTIIAGIAAFNGVVYVNVQSNSGTPGANHGIFRLNLLTGTQIESTPWINTTDDALAYSIATVAYQHLAIAGGILAVAGRVGGSLVLQQWNLVNRTLSHSTTLQSSFAHYPCKVVTDAGANFYVLTEVAAGAANQLYKIDWAGNIPSQFNAGTAVSTGGTGRDICYDPVSLSVVLCGSALGGTTDSVRFYNATTGAFVAGGQPKDATSAGSGISSWHAVAADGLSTIVSGQSVGGIRLRRAIGSNIVNVASYTGPTSSEYGLSAGNGKYNRNATWVISNDLETGAFSGTLWLVCSGLSVVPTKTSMNSTRITRALGVVGGSLYDYSSGTPVLITSNFVSGAATVVNAAMGRSGANGQICVVYTDGAKYRVYNLSTEQTSDLVATAGTLPTDINGSKCRLMCSWRGSVVMAGLLTDPHNIFGCHQDDIGNWAYSPKTYDAQQAWAGSLSPCGRCPDIINTLIPVNDDVLLTGGDSSIWKLSGHPAQGGRWDQVSETVGMAFGAPWCKDPQGNVYFMSTVGSVYRYGSDGSLTNISDMVDSNLFFNIDKSENLITMAWDERWGWLYMFVSPLDPTQSTTHYLWDSQADQSKPSGSWWPFIFANKNHNPLAVAVSDGDDPADRTIVMGSRNGYLLTWDDEGESDDGQPITSYIDMYIKSPANRQFKLLDFQPTLWYYSGDVTWSIRSGPSPQSAFSAAYSWSGTFKVKVDSQGNREGRQRSPGIRQRGPNIFLRFGSTAVAPLWAIESINGVIEPITGIAAQRNW